MRTKKYKVYLSELERTQLLIKNLGESPRQSRGLTSMGYFRISTKCHARASQGSASPSDACIGLASALVSRSCGAIQSYPPRPNTV